MNKCGALWATCLVALGCGEPLVDEGFGGEPQATLTIQAIDDSEGIGEARIGLFWSSSFEKQEFEDLVEDPNASLDIEAGPVTLNVFATPPESVLHDWPGGSGKRAALGTLYAYDDANDSGVHDDDERWLGEVVLRGIFYAPEKIKTSEGPNRLAIPSGFSIARTPFLCEDAAEPTDEDCGVLFGNQCSSTDICGAGFCMEMIDTPWPRGTCALAGTDPECVPERGALIFTPPPIGSVFVEACRSDSDCTHPFGYECDRLAGACVPPQGLMLMLRTSVRAPPPLCAGDGAPPGVHEMPPPR